MVAALAAMRLNGQLVSLAAVIGPLACALGGAMRRSAGAGTLRSGWWRTAFGTQPRAVVAWAVAASLPGMLFVAGGALGLGWELGALRNGIVWLPTCVLALLVHRLWCLAVDVGFPAAIDRAGPGAAARVAAIGAIGIAIVVLVWSCARAGVGTMAGVADLTLVTTGLAAARITTQRLAV